MHMTSPDTAARRAEAVVLLSGGLDSCVTAAIAASEHRGALGFLHVNYGQRTRMREQTSFRQIAAHFGVNLCLEVDGTFLSQIGGSSLTDPALPVPDAEIEDAAGAVPSTYVPFRNALFLSMAVAWAEVLGAEEVYLGIHEEGSAYPDCSADFLAAFAALARCGARPDAGMTVKAPLLDMGKADIVRRGTDLDAPLHLTWSCYRNGAHPCNACLSCNLRRRGFEDAGVRDPLRHGPCLPRQKA